MSAKIRQKMITYPDLQKCRRQRGLLKSWSSGSELDSNILRQNKTSLCQNQLEGRKENIKFGIDRPWHII